MLSINLLLTAMIATVIALLVLAITMSVQLSKQKLKNNELYQKLNVLNKELILMQDAERGIGRRLVELERQVQKVVRVQAVSDMPAADNTFVEIARRLDAGQSAEAIVSELQATESEVALVDMLRKKTTEPA